jgi:hypothetical protein
MEYENYRKGKRENNAVATLGKCKSNEVESNCNCEAL